MCACVVEEAGRGLACSLAVFVRYSRTLPSIRSVRGISEVAACMRYHAGFSARRSFRQLSHPVTHAETRATAFTDGSNPGPARNTEVLSSGGCMGA